MIRRLISLLAVIVLLAAGLLFMPPFGFLVGQPITEHEVAVEAQDLQLVCPGPVYKSSKTNVARFVQEGDSRLTAVSSPDSTATYQAFGTAKNAIGSAPSEVRFNKAISLVGSPKRADLTGSALLSAIEFQRLESDWGSGLLGSSCQRPSNDIWLVGGDTRTGREALLVLANSSNVDATVEVSIISSTGPVTGPGLSGVSVPKHHTTVLPINGVIPDTETFAVRVQARGGAIGAWMQQRAVRGTKSAGLDWITPVAPAATDLTIPGFLVRGVKDAKELQSGNPSFNDISNFVRMVNPTNREATVLVRVTGSTSETFGTVIQQKISANSAADIAVTGLEDGDYTIFISSDQPVLAAAKLNRTGLANTPNTDFTWLPALLAFSGTQTLPVPSAGIAKLVLANPSKQMVSVVVRTGGSTRTVDIAPASSMTLKVDGGLLSIESSSAVAATVILDVRGSLTNFALVEYRNLGGSVSVLVQ